MGGVTFGHLGDRVGRKPAMFATLLLGGATTAVGALPGNASLGCSPRSCWPR